MGSLKSTDTELQVESPVKVRDRAKRLPGGHHPIEIEYWYILPTLRREVAVNLKEFGRLRQKEIADILGITEAAVSQYIKGTRGVLELEDGGILLIPDWLIAEIKKSVNEILKDTKDRSQFLKEINRLMTVIRDNPLDFLCPVHIAFGRADENCKICLDEP